MLKKEIELNVIVSIDLPCKDSGLLRLGLQKILLLSTTDLSHLFAKLGNLSKINAYLG